MSAANERIERLERELERMAAELTALQQKAGTNGDGTDEGEAAVSRRRLLKLAGAGAAGAAGAALLSVPAGAADPNDVVLGSTNTSSSSTIINSSSTSAFVVNTTSATPGATGIVGTSPDTTIGTGIFGSGFAGVHGQSAVNNGNGVLAKTTGNGASTYALRVEPQGTDNTGVIITNPGPNCLGIQAVGTRAPLMLTPMGTGAPTTGAHEVGELVVDTNADFWLCRVAGSPGTWYKLNSQFGGSGDGVNLLAAPVRIYDSRPGLAPVAVGPKTPLAVNEDRQIDATANSSGVPASASAVLLNLAVTGTVGAGFLGVFKDGISYPGNANINWSQSNQNISNAVTTAVANSGKLRVHCGGNPTNVVIDVIGYY